MKAGNSLKLLGLLTFSGLLFTLEIFSQSPTIVILNADIRTMDKLKPRAEAVAITENKITAVGKNAQIRKLIRKETKVIDAKGKLVIPGFNDSHVHFFGVGTRFFSINLKDAKNSTEILEQIRFHAKFLPKGKWIIGGFQTDSDYPLKIMPSKSHIDEITPNHPVLLYLKGANVAFANSYALDLAKIKDNQDGILRDSAVSLVRRQTPPYIFSDVSAILEAATNYAASVGVTSVQDMDGDNRFEIYGELKKQNKLKTRIYDCIPLMDWQKLADPKITRATGDTMIRRGCLKHFSDGDKDKTPYLFDLINSADKADLQVMMHAIGTQANDVVLTVFEKVLQQNGAKDRRFRIEHAHNFTPPDLKRFVASKTIASMQPYLFFDGSGDDSKLFRQMLDAKALLAFGSDANIVDLNPMLGIHAAVFGKGISVEEAVRTYTLDSAFAEFQENVKGSITVEKLADLIILSENIFIIPTARIEKVQVLQTIMDGKIVYADKSWTN